MTSAESRQRDGQLVRQLAGVKTALDRLTNVLTDQFHQDKCQRKLINIQNEFQFELVYF